MKPRCMYARQKSVQVHIQICYLRFPSSTFLPCHGAALFLRKVDIIANIMDINWQLAFFSDVVGNVKYLQMALAPKLDT